MEEVPVPGPHRPRPSHEPISAIRLVQYRFDVGKIGDLSDSEQEVPDGSHPLVEAREDQSIGYPSDPLRLSPKAEDQRNMRQEPTERQHDGPRPQRIFQQGTCEDVLGRFGIYVSRISDCYFTIYTYS